MTAARPRDRERLAQRVTELRDLDRLVREPGRNRPLPAPVPLMLIRPDRPQTEGETAW